MSEQEQTPREIVTRWLNQVPPPVQSHIREAIWVVLGALEQAEVARLRAQWDAGVLAGMRDALRLACNVSAADLTEAGRICGIADDEYPLRAVERVLAERDTLREKLGAALRIAGQAFAPDHTALEMAKVLR